MLPFPLRVVYSSHHSGLLRSVCKSHPVVLNRGSASTLKVLTLVCFILSPFGFLAYSLGGLDTLDGNLLGLVSVGL